MAFFKELNGYEVKDAKAWANTADEYDATAAYAVGDYCLYEGDLYKCNTAIATGGEAWNSTHWTATQIMDEVATAVDVSYDSQTEALTFS